MRKQLIGVLGLVAVACGSDASDEQSGESSSSKAASTETSSNKSGPASNTASVATGSSKDQAPGGSASDPEAAPASGIPGLDIDVSWPAAPDGLATEKVDAAPTFHITRPADLGSLKHPMPVIVWANGGCLRSDFSWVPLFNHWAEAGFIVLSLTGMGEDGDLFSMLGFTSNTEHKQLIDWVVAQNKEGQYAGKMDLERIVVAGNSCGGVTALQVASQDERVAAVFVLSGSSAVGSVDKTVMEKVTVPVGYIVGGSEDIAGANAKGDYDAMKEGLPAMIVHRRAGDHPTVSTDPMVLPQNAEISLNWLELALYGKQQAYDDLKSENVCDVCTPGDWTLESKNLESLLKKK